MADIVPTPAAPAASTAPSKGIMDKFKLDGKVCAVTGGARGLGFEMLRGFCEAGAAGIAILDVLQEHGEEAIKEINTDFGIPASFYRVDVRDHVAVEEAINGIVRDFGSLDVLLCSAGVVDNLPAETYPADRFKRVMDINLNGLFFACQSAGKHMIESGRGGSIINIASMSGHIVNYPQPQSAYNASKAAVIHLSKSLAAEWAPHKIRVNTISPGYM
ncbi:NAD(P)-binding protein [Clavulina sp. PMI_390]|nr:NAD(P)-binding protein [Clavulina sp. PMI_390]